MLDQIAQAGFNTLRLPFSNQLFDPSSKPQGIDYKLNPDLKGLSGLALLDRIIQGAGSDGLKVILDRHDTSADTRPALWYTDQVPQARWLQDWVTLAQHYRGNATVIGADLASEVHGPATWGDGNLRTDWRLAAGEAGNAILANNPNLQTAEVPSINLRSGFLENANTSATAEMVNLISAMRYYEANQRIIQMQDDRMGRTISELGNPG